MPQPINKAPSLYIQFYNKFKVLTYPAHDQSDEQYEAPLAQSIKDGKIHPDLATTGTWHGSDGSIVTVN